jgi:hypothetical protein
VDAEYRSRCKQENVAVVLVVGREGSVEGVRRSKREEESSYMWLGLERRGGANVSQSERRIEGEGRNE